MAIAAVAQDFSGLARVDPAHSQIVDVRGGIAVELALSQPVPYRVFTLDAPRRLIVDFREADWTGVERRALLNADRVQDVHFGPLYPGWSRLVVELAGPMSVVEAGMSVSPETGRATVLIRTETSDEADFAARAGAPEESIWDKLQTETEAQVAEGKLVVAIDAGHGGIDPGAQRAGIKEADLMLALAIEIKEEIDRNGEIGAVLTRDGDYFVSLEDRMTRARSAGAVALISLHADALERGRASGASIFTLNAQAEDEASARMAERHERGDLLAGLDLTGQDDRVAGVLMDLARLDTAPASDQLAEALLSGMLSAGVKLHPRARREGRLAVLNASDFASVLVEAGFLSDAGDRAMLSNPQTRRPLVQGLVDGIIAWAVLRAVNAPLIRQ